jgi:hypothetical protein
MNADKILLVGILVIGSGLLPGAQAAGRRSTLGLRKKLHVNPLITDPDTIEVDWSGVFPLQSFPSAVRYTPRGSFVFWGRTEFSATFDLHAHDQATFAATCVVLDSDKFDIAVAPLLSVGNGTHGGAYGIARYDEGRSSFGVTLSHLAGTTDAGVGYGFQFAKAFTAHSNLQWEWASGTPRTLSVFEGVEWQISDAVAVDVSGQHQPVWGGARDNQLVIAVTFSSPKLHRH